MTRVLTAVQLAQAFEAGWLATPAPELMHRPYRWRDPQRVTAGQLAHLEQLDSAGEPCAGCGRRKCRCAT
jgi:hypothetical protein